MRYINHQIGAGTSGLSLQQTAPPDIRPNEVLIRVRAVGINRPDLLQRDGLYPPPKNHSPILGLEVAGVVESVGSEVASFRLGDTVCALVNGGGYAEFVAAAATQCLPIPDGYSMVEAAAIPEAFFTVWHNLFQRAKLQQQETLLVHGGASGIGTTAIQLARQFNITVFVTAAGQAKCAACEALGAIAFDYKAQDFVTEIKNHTTGKGVSVILDMVGGEYIEKNIQIAAHEGRIVNIAFLQGSRQQVDFMPIMLKRLTLMGSTLRAQSAEVKASIAVELYQQVWPLLAARKITPVIDSTFPFERVADAHAHMESNQHIGKIVLTL